MQLFCSCSSSTQFINVTEKDRFGAENHQSVEKQKSFAMKTEQGIVDSPITTNTVIWGNNVELPQLFSGEECLPVIGSSQVSSILSTLDSQEKSVLVEPSPTDLELIVLRNEEKPFASPTLKTDVLPRKDESKAKTRNLTYIMCEMCPFLCLNQKKITEHVGLAHKTSKPSRVFEVNCPGCTNTFYHELSLQAHLTYDHCMSSVADVEKIIEIALHTKKSIVYCSKTPVWVDVEKMPLVLEDIRAEEVGRPAKVHCKIEVETKYNVPTESNESEDDERLQEENLPDKPVEDLPTSEKAPNGVEKFGSYVRRSNGISKFLDDNKAHKCEVDGCKVRMEGLEKLTYHTQCHAEGIFKCRECDDMFSLWKTLAGHLWRSHKIDMELYRCDKCDYRSASLSRLNNTHRLIHGSLKGYTCDVCQKGFKNAKQLRNHKDTHKKPDSANHSCKECDKAFNSNHRLRIHMDGIHKKLRPYLCNYCGYKGATRGALKMHVRQHTGEKPFKCDMCDYSTADHNSLRRHKLRHSGVKPYKCSHCDYQCIQTSTYKVHIKTKHPGLDKELLFSCDVCQFRSINRDVYNLHVTSQHPEIK